MDWIPRLRERMDVLGKKKKKNLQKGEKRGLQINRDRRAKKGTAGAVAAAASNSAVCVQVAATAEA